MALTIKDVHPYISRVSVGGIASVRSGVGLHRLLDEQTARCHVALFRNQADAASWGVEVNHVGIERPEHGRRGLRCEAHQTRQVDGGAHVDEEVRTSEYFRHGFWKNATKCVSVRGTPAAGQKLNNAEVPQFFFKFNRTF